MDVLTSMQVPLVRRAERRALLAGVVVLLGVVAAVVMRVVAVPEVFPLGPDLTVEECVEGGWRSRCGFSTLSVAPSVETIEEGLLVGALLPRELPRGRLGDEWHAILEPTDRAFLAGLLHPPPWTGKWSDPPARRSAEEIEGLRAHVERYRALYEQAWTCVVRDENARRGARHAPALARHTAAVREALAPRWYELGSLGFALLAGLVARRTRRAPATLDAVGLDVDGERFRWEDLAGLEWYPTQLVVVPVDRPARRFEGLTLTSAEVDALQALSDRLRSVRTGSADGADAVETLLLCAS